MTAERKISYYKREDPLFPEALRKYDRMPRGIYVLGHLPDPAKPSAAIVGARSCSGYGRREALRFAGALAECGVQIISGMAAGIDSYAHTGALQKGGETFAVLGCGADICYPAGNRAVYEQIIEKGGILSEFEPGSEPLSWHFPVRNRIISALADVILVVEARRRSGALITVDYALEQGKSVYAVPGRAGDPLSEGCNTLIAQGAGIASSPDAILQELGILPPSGGKSGQVIPDSWGRDEKNVWRHLECCGKSLDQLLAETHLPLARLTNILMAFCLSGHAEEVTQGFYRQA